MSEKKIQRYTLHGIGERLGMLSAYDAGTEIIVRERQIRPSGPHPPIYYLFIILFDFNVVYPVCLRKCMYSK